MIEAVETKDWRPASFARFEKGSTGNLLPWLHEARGRALSRFAEIGLPTERDEDWKFTSVQAIAESSFWPAAGDGLDDVKTDQLQEVAFEAFKSCQLVFINGRYSPQLSHVAALPKRMRLGSLEAHLSQDPELLESHLTQHAKFQADAFAALNTAFFNDGAFVYLPKGTVLERPIHLLFISKPNGAMLATHPRVLIVAEQDAKARVVESYLGLGSGTYLTNGVTEVVLGENASIDHYKLQREGLEASHVASWKVHQARNSRYTSHSLSLGGGLVRNDIAVTLAEEGAECVLNGLYMASGRRHVDHHTTIDHAQPHCTSHELYKGILDDHAGAIFNGTIIVQPGAQKTNAMQSNKNLLLSEGGQINTKPELKIFANDVKCKHGATIGQISSDALFYLRSRGICPETARQMLIYAFASEMVERIGIVPLRDLLEAFLSVHLPGGEEASP